MSHAPVPGGGSPGLRPQDRIANLVIAALVAAVAVAAMVAARDFPPTMLETDVGPARFPVVYALVLIALSVVLAVNTLRAPAAAPDAVPAGERPSYASVALGMAATAACLVAMAYVGYAIATVVYLFGLMTLMGRRKPQWNAVIAVGLTALVYAVFLYGLHVPLPVGSLFE